MIVKSISGFRAAIDQNFTQAMPGLGWAWNCTKKAHNMVISRAEKYHDAAHEIMM